MRRLISLLLLLGTTSFLAAQGNIPCKEAKCPEYQTFMEQGKLYMAEEKYLEALTEFQAAQVAARICDCDTYAVPAELINASANAIVAQKQAAIDAQARAQKAEGRAQTALDQVSANEKALQQALKEIKVAKAEAEASLQQAKKLVNAFYFYADRFALAFGEIEDRKAYYFIDKNGDEAAKLGRWTKGEQFDYSGFAEVGKDGINYLLDTMGNTYRVAFSVAELSPDTLVDIRALDLRSAFFIIFPDDIITTLTQLEVLLLDGRGGVFSVDPFLKSNLSKIVHFQKLKYLSLRDRELDSLPMYFILLTNLEFLDLSGNQFPESEKARIKAFLPNVNIKF
jgi:hypothetical protein